MKVVIKSDGKIVRSKDVPNKMHFEVQKSTKASVIPSKKQYKRSRDKKKYEYNI